ncbi:hypothetical protein SteCoe_118 [Stentor coeruleus]|uniref:Uncharacterized protein n=1 Tax=Stentor coeruleus TaxID=5963 RepID=A0A1R2D526_9CILI|nr:hypothetical protein SteCoe_118 [Stentor coeruleus]
MEVEEIITDDIDVVVFGEGSEEFSLRMFKKEPRAFTVNEWGAIKQITQIVSTDHLFLHFNFYIVPENIFEESIEILKKDIYLGIVTYLLDDVMSFEKSGELYDKYIQDSIVPLKSQPGRVGICSNSIIPEELSLINLWFPNETHQIIPAGIKAAICSERKAAILMKENRDGVLKHVKFITKSEESPYVEEKHAIFMWMFENYLKKNKKLNITPQHIGELKKSFEGLSSGLCNIF